VLHAEHHPPGRSTGAPGPGLKVVRRKPRKNMSIIQRTRKRRKRLARTVRKKMTAGNQAGGPHLNPHYPKGGLGLEYLRRQGMWTPGPWRG
jgi:hypothetical protein